MRASIPGDSDLASFSGAGAPHPQERCPSGLPVGGDLLERFATTDRLATLALRAGLWVRRLLIGGGPFQGRCPASQVNDGGCPEKPDHFTLIRGGA